MMQIFLRRVLSLFLFWAAFSGAAQADLDFRYQAMGSFVSVNPSALGGEAGLSALLEPFTGFPLWIGPKFSILAAQGDMKTRLDFNTGIEGTLWFVNAIGPGLAVDLVAPSTVNGVLQGVHYRLEPNIAVRLRHYQKDGAWALRFGVPYDSLYQWGIQAGLLLELNGVPGPSI